MDTKKPEGTLFDPDVTNRLVELAKFIAGHQDIDEKKAYKLVRRHIYRIFLDLEQSGEADVFGLGRLKKDPEGGYKLYHYSEKAIKRREQLHLQQQYGGVLGNVGDRPPEEYNIRADFDFPVEAFIEKLAEHTDVSADELKKKFQDQLEQAYGELMEKGVGYLPDFGCIRSTGDKLSTIEFDLNEEVVEIFKKHQPEDPDDE